MLHETSVGKAADVRVGISVLSEKATRRINNFMM
jgi:hypothetical protein